MKVTTFRRLEGEERKKAIEEPGKSWKQWAREDLARYWYVILCLFVDIMLNLTFVEAYSRYGGTYNLILAVISLAALVPAAYVEYMIYKRLFPFRFQT